MWFAGEAGTGRSSLAIISRLCWFIGSRKMINVKKFCSYLVIAKERIKRIMKPWKHNLGVKVAQDPLQTASVGKSES